MLPASPPILRAALLPAGLVAWQAWLISGSMAPLAVITRPIPMISSMLSPHK